MKFMLQVKIWEIKQWWNRKPEPIAIVWTVLFVLLIIIDVVGDLT